MRIYEYHGTTATIKHFVPHYGSFKLIQNVGMFQNVMFDCASEYPLEISVIGDLRGFLPYSRIIDLPKNQCHDKQASIQIFDSIIKIFW